MIRPDQIPYEVVEAATHAVVSAAYKIDPDARVSELTMGEYGALSRAAIAAALSVWPGAWAVPMYSDPKTMLHLPLPQKDSIEDVGDA